MIPVLLMILFACAALIYVGLPLRGGPRREAAEIPSPAREAAEKKTAALAGIVDLEQEHAAGKLSTEDLAELRAGYESEVLQALDELDVAGQSSPDEELEKEIAATRQQLACPSCGAPRSAGTPCVRCGT